MKDPLDVEVEARGDKVRLRVRGELDAHSAPLLERVLRNVMGADKHVVLDLARVPFIDSTGIAAVLDAAREAAARDWRLTISPEMSPSVLRIIELTGMSPLLERHE